MRDPRRFAEIFTPRLQEAFKDLPWGEMGLTAEQGTLSKDDVIRVLSGPICEHGGVRLVDCLECGTTAVLAEQYQKISELVLGGRMPDDDAWALAVSNQKQFGDPHYLER